MKALVRLFYALALAFFAGCVAQDASKLRVGMTKDEVLKVMGKPVSTETDGAYEYLAFAVDGEIRALVPQRGSDSPNRDKPYIGRVVEKKPYTVLLKHGLLESYRLGIFRGPLSANQIRPTSIKIHPLSPDSAINNVQILSLDISPEKPDAPIELTMRIAYALKEENGCQLAIKISSHQPTSLTNIGGLAVPKGTGELEFVATMTAKEAMKWREKDHSVRALLARARGDSKASLVFASCEHKITFAR